MLVLELMTILFLSLWEVDAAKEFDGLGMRLKLKLSPRGNHVYRK
jgi:hypothetical protein